MNVKLRRRRTFVHSGSIIFDFFLVGLRAYHCLLELYLSQFTSLILLYHLTDYRRASFRSSAEQFMLDLFEIVANSSQFCVIVAPQIDVIFQSHLVN